MLYIKGIKGVLLDFDGVVADTEYLNKSLLLMATMMSVPTVNPSDALKFMLSLNGLRREEVLDRCAKSDYYMLERLFPIRDRVMSAIVAEFGVRLKPGILELLKYCSREKLKVGIVSSRDLNSIEMILKKHNIRKYINAIVAKCSVGMGKPDKEPYCKGAEMLSLSPAECLACEDAEVGIQSAFDAGCVPCFVKDLTPSTESIRGMTNGRTFKSLEGVRLFLVRSQ